MKYVVYRNDVPIGICDTFVEVLNKQYNNVGIIKLLHSNENYRTVRINDDIKIYNWALSDNEIMMIYKWGD
jgi:hypothetical protein